MAIILVYLKSYFDLKDSVIICPGVIHEHNRRKKKTEEKAKVVASGFVGNNLFNSLLR